MKKILCRLTILSVLIAAAALTLAPISNDAEAARAGSPWIIATDPLPMDPEGQGVGNPAPPLQCQCSRCPVNHNCIQNPAAWGPWQLTDLIVPPSVTECRDNYNNTNVQRCR